MLKLVVSNKGSQVQDLVVDTPDRFRAGEILEQNASGDRVLVVACASDGSTAMLMPLPDGELYEAHIANMQGWRTPYLPGPRLVEVRHKAARKTIWSSYVPDFDTALAVWRKFELLHPNDYVVEIYAQHQDEIAILDVCGYFNSGVSAKPSA